jgi:hypothetical protein
MASKKEKSEFHKLCEEVRRLAERVCKLEKEEFGNVIPIVTPDENCGAGAVGIAYRERFGYSNPLNNIYSIAAELTTYKGSQSAEMDYLTRVADDLRLCARKIHYDEDKAAT